MSKQLPGQLRNYAVTLINLVPPSCNDFLNFTKNQITGQKNLIGLSTSNTDKECKIELEMTCWSCGNNGINKFSKIVKIQYPLAEIIFKRKYKD
jgi:hypothetical protein